MNELLSSLDSGHKFWVCFWAIAGASCVLISITTAVCTCFCAVEETKRLVVEKAKDDLLIEKGYEQVPVEVRDEYGGVVGKIVWQKIHEKEAPPHADRTDHPSLSGGFLQA